MSSDLDDLVEKLETLDLYQQQELEQLLATHRKEKQTLVKSAKPVKPIVKKKPAPIPDPPVVLSHSRIPLKQGDRVRLRTKASIGNRGDIATVLHVLPSRIDIRVHCIPDYTWRQAGNLEHI